MNRSTAAPIRPHVRTRLASGYDTRLGSRLLLARARWTPRTRARTTVAAR